MKNIAIILGGGNSSRCGTDKLFFEKFESPPIFRTLKIFQNCAKIDEIILVLHEKNLTKKNLILKKFSKISAILRGGKKRFFSLQNAIKFCEQKKIENAKIIVHNAANPNLKNDELIAGINFSDEKKNVIFGFFSPNSIKKVARKKVVEFLDRAEIFETQTPQISDFLTLKKAIDFFEKNKKKIREIPRDEAEILNLIGEKIFIFECSAENKKITFPADLQKNFRIGVGEDSHKFAENFSPQKKLILGGAEFLEKKNLAANSDGDVIFHALSNAILSAAGEKTLDNFAAKMCENGEKNSRKYVEKSLKIARQKFPNFTIENVAILLEAKIPKIAPQHEKIQKNCAKILKINFEKIGLSYHSGENLTDCGKGRGVRVFCEILVSI